MIYNLTDKYRINTQDSHNIAIEKIGTRKTTGKPYWRGVSFHGSLKSCLVACLDDSRFVFEVKNKEEMEEWMEKIRKISKEIYADSPTNA